MNDQEKKMNQEEQQKSKGLEGGPLALALAGAALVGGGIVAAGGWAKGKLKDRKARKAEKKAEKAEDTEEKNENKKKK